jgi:arylsulfatase A-like enzyme
VRRRRALALLYDEDVLGALARVLAVSVLLTLSTCAVAGPPSEAPAPGAAERPPSVLVLLTDDQRWDTLWAMPAVLERIGGHGVTFANAYVTNPSCCPSRTSLLTGLASPATGVWANSGDHGGFPAFDDRSTLATWLDDAGYRTGLFGKYLNGYDPASGYVPPGWDAWLAGADEFFYDYSFLDAREGGRAEVRTYGDDPADYSTRVLTRRARSFLSATSADTPFFAVVSYHAPHPPGTPDPRDADAFPDLPAYRPPSFDEADVSDKPAYVRDVPRLGPRTVRELDALRLDQVRSLAAVDRSVGRILSTLRSLGRLEDTLVVFTSDNGYQWGEHRWTGKGVPYEESVRVPLVVRYDPLVGGEGAVSDGLVLVTDLAPTVAELVGLAPPPMDGTSFTDLLRDPSAPFRDTFAIEHRAENPGRPTFCAVRSGPWAFVRYYERGEPTEAELYDLAGDPYQLENVADAPGSADERARLEAEADARCVVPPP